MGLLQYLGSLKVGVASALALAGVMLRGGYRQHCTVQILEPGDGIHDRTVELFVS
jgi:hypothetical protein